MGQRIARLAALPPDGPGAFLRTSEGSPLDQAG